MDLKIVEQTHEASWDGYVYRFVTSEKGTMVKRSPIEDGTDAPLWNHGLIVQTVKEGQSIFEPIVMCLGSIRHWDSLSEAVSFVEGFA